MINLSLKYDFVEKNQEATLEIDFKSIDKIFLSVANRTARNRTSLYQKKHPSTGVILKGPVKLKTKERDPEISALNQHIREHYEFIREIHDDPFVNRPVISFTISDLTANPLRPHYDALISPEKRAFQSEEAKRAIYKDDSDGRLFYLEDEPIGKVPYTLLFSYEEEERSRFAIYHEVIVQRNGSLPFNNRIHKVVNEGLKWWSACPPLLISGEHRLEQFAILDYDLRHVFGVSEKAFELIREIYQSFPIWDEWCKNINQKLSDAELPKAYHAGLGISKDGKLIVIHRIASIPDLAEELKRLGAHEAVLLDSGGSCALWANWANGDQGGILSNQQGYFRPARGAVVFLVLKGACHSISLRE